MTIIYFIILLGVIVCIHEAGHLLAAKKFGVYCFEYSFGMGPVLFQKKGRETVYSIRAIPIGGYVAMAGETDGDELYEDVKVPEGRRISDISTWKRIVIMLAGVFMSFVLAWLIFSLIALSNGRYAASPKPVIASVMEGSPAEKAGFAEGDRIIKVSAAGGGSVKPRDFTDMQLFTAQYVEDELIYTADRNGETRELHVTPVYYEDYGTYLIGITGPEAEVFEVNALNCWGYGFQEMASVTRSMINTLRQLVRGRGLNQLSGPVGIYNVTGEYASYGLLPYLFLIAEISLNVGILNLMPVPVLDGGQVVMVLAEKLIGKPLNQKLKMAVMGVCWAFLIGLMIFITWNDIARLFG